MFIILLKKNLISHLFIKLILTSKVLELEGEDWNIRRNKLLGSWYMLGNILKCFTNSRSFNCQLSNYFILKYYY